jgi:hypothetical protein
MSASTVSGHSSNAFPVSSHEWQLAEMGHPYPRKLEPDVVWVQKRFIVSECMPSMELGGQTGGGVVLLTFN